MCYRRAAANEQVKTMSNEKLSIGFVRRGYSATGGAEAYLQRLARGIVDLGHEVRLITTPEWPANAWPFGEITHLRADSAIAFADELEKLRSQIRCDVLLSLERVWRCDVYRAGDGVHRAWLERRNHLATPLRKLSRLFNRKHDDILRLEKSLFADGGAGRVIANSQMVKKEIVDLYGYPADKIGIVRNGVPIDRFRFDSARREKARADLKLANDEIALLFVGTGWERKGLRFAIDAVKPCQNLKLRLLVAGRGNALGYKSARVQFLGEVGNLVPIYAAADIFVIPTIYDPFSNASLEALASGLPVITTRSNGFSEIIENNVHGSIVDLANDVEALSAAISFWSDESRRSSARSAISQRAAQFDISKNVEQTLAILLQAAAEPGS
jgi:UDP-glucose:(heptosyl)LPS alpha-1,3-glucosyltransferase